MFLSPMNNVQWFWAFCLWFVENVMLTENDWSLSQVVLSPCIGEDNKYFLL